MHQGESGLEIGTGRSADFPSVILRKDRLRLAYWLLRARVRDYGYAVNFADAYYRYWKRSYDRFSWPSLGS